MTQPRFTVGERVIAMRGANGEERPGVVVGVISGTIASRVWGEGTRYLVRFDGDGGLLGPCVVLRAEGEREEASPRTGTAA